ncbi:MAG: hypothetical protein KDI69_07230 [Xanthomonadales bacterium]|nr:hypothetical protein [Xanthomonadales bacterium]
MSLLSLILFLPAFVILGGLFLLFPRTPRSGVRAAFDLAALLLALAGSIVGMRWAYFNADHTVGAIWPQVLATLMAYAVFIAILLIALFARHQIWRAREGSA